MTKSSSVSVYCVKCRSKTPTVNPHRAVAKNGRKMIKGKCSRCGCSKVQFTK